MTNMQQTQGVFAFHCVAHNYLLTKFQLVNASSLFLFRHLSTNTTNATNLNMGNILCFLFGFCIRFETPTFPAAAPVPVVTPPADINDESVWYMQLDLQSIPPNSKPYYEIGGHFWANVITAGVSNVDTTGLNLGQIPGSDNRCTIPDVVDDIVSSRAVCNLPFWTTFSLYHLLTISIFTI